MQGPSTESYAWKGAPGDVQSMQLASHRAHVGLSMIDPSRRQLVMLSSVAMARQTVGRGNLSISPFGSRLGREPIQG